MSNKVADMFFSDEIAVIDVLFSKLYIERCSQQIESKGDWKSNIE